MQRWGWALFFALSCSCWGETPSSLEPVAAPTMRFHALTHPRGTLLRDSTDRYWVVARWPDREELLPSMVDLAHYDIRQAIPLSAEEAQCLRASSRIWHPRTLWRLVRLPTGDLWYVNDVERLRRRARRAVIDAWRDSDALAVEPPFSLELFETRFRDTGPMPPPDGAIFVNQGRYLYFAEGRLRPFADQVLVGQVGYASTQAIPVSFGELAELGDAGEVLTASSFQVCPLAAAQLRASEDRDGDGTPFFQDCDDEDPRRHPAHTEMCDGIDNDCDLVVDNGFDVGVRCIMNDACRTPTYTRCADHRLGTLCWDDEAECP